MSKLTPKQQESVARQLVRDYHYLGVTLKAARKAVATGKWDDRGFADEYERNMPFSAADAFRKQYPPE